VLLLLLAIAGGLLYARWQPIRGFVVSRVAARWGQAQGPALQPPPASPAAEQAAISVAPSQPEQTNPPAPPQAVAAEPSRPPAEAGSAPSAADNAAAATEANDKTGPEDKANAPAVARERPQPAPGETLVNSGEKYLYGRGVRKDCGQAVRYFRAAAEQQNSRALVHLGAMYAIGECVPMDRAVAYSWFSRALAGDRGNRALEENLTMLWREMSPRERQRAAAR